MGKAMMGTGEAEGEGRAMKATEMAISNPLIDDYTLKGAKGLLVNITGSKDLKLFEVDEVVNKIRSEVEADAEVIIGAITDASLEGKIRVSIVATSLDNQQPETKSVINMVHRIQNRNTGYSDFATTGATSSFAFSNNNSNPVSHGANALKLENEVVNENFNDSIDETNNKYHEELLRNQEAENEISFSQEAMNTPETQEDLSNDLKEFGVDTEEPDLFNSDNQTLSSEGLSGSSEEVSEEDDLEIPAFLRRQKN
jgi:cell division protein FtsZ